MRNSTIAQEDFINSDSDHVSVLNTAGTPDTTSVFEHGITSSDREHSELGDDKDELSVVQESLNVYANELKHLISSKTGTVDTLAIMRFGIQQQLNRIEQRLPAIGMESSDLDILAQHQLVLESMKEIREKIKTWINRSVTHFKDILSDTFSSTQTMLFKYEEILKSAHTEWEQKKPVDGDKRQKNSLIELWYHFSTDKGEVKDLVPAITKDVELSTYLLTVYPEKICQIADKFDSFFPETSAIKTPKDIEALAIKIESIPVAADIFDKKWLASGKPYLSVTGLELKTGSRRNELSISDDGKVLTKLAYLASAKYIVETSSVSHGVKKVAHNLAKPVAAANAAAHVVIGAAVGGFAAGVPGAVVGGAAGSSLAAFHVANLIDAMDGKEISLSSEEIEQLFKLGQQYINNVKVYLTLIKKFQPKGGRFITFLDGLWKDIPKSSEDYPSLDETDEELMNRIDENQNIRSAASWYSEEAEGVLEQIESVDFNIWRCFTNPAKNEIARSLKGAKYIAYLLNSVVKVAK